MQSHVRAHVELMWLLNSVTPIGWLNKMIQFKEKSRKAVCCSDPFTILFYLIFDHVQISVYIYTVLVALGNWVLVSVVCCSHVPCFNDTSKVVQMGVALSTYVQHATFDRKCTIKLSLSYSWHIYIETWRFKVFFVI